jgi:hypothetical protein
VRKCCFTVLTLIIRYGHQQEGQCDCPSAHVVEKGREHAIDVQLRYLVCDFRVGRGGYEAHVDRHCGMGAEYRRREGAGDDNASRAARNRNFKGSRSDAQLKSV